MSAEFSTSLRRCINLAADLEILLHCGPPSSLKASSEFKKASRKSDSYVEQYDTAVARQDFNLMIHDKSFFQFSEKEGESELRFAFYPNPYLFVEYRDRKEVADELLANGDLSESEFEQLLNEGGFTFDAPLIRYDLAYAGYCERYHPAAHFHIGFLVENRWPVGRVLTPLAFLLLVLFHYYPALWKAKEEAADARWLESLYIKEISNCCVLDEKFFKASERLRLVFGV